MTLFTTLLVLIFERLFKLAAFMAWLSFVFTTPFVMMAHVSLLLLN